MLSSGDLHAIIVILFGCVWIAVLVALQKHPCDDPDCQRVGLIHVERDRRRRVTAQHDWHKTPEPDCERCDGRE